MSLFTIRVEVQPIDIRVHLPHDSSGTGDLKNILTVIAESIVNLKETVMASDAELQKSLDDLGTQLDKAQAEIVKKIADLEAAIAAGPQTTPEVDAALAALKGKVQALDDLNPDAPTP